MAHLVNRHSHRIYITLLCRRLRCTYICKMFWWRITQILVPKNRNRTNHRVSLFTNNTCVSGVREKSTAVLIDEDVSLNLYKREKMVCNLREPHRLERTMDETDPVEIF